MATLEDVSQKLEEQNQQNGKIVESIDKMKGKVGESIDSLSSNIGDTMGGAVMAITQSPILSQGASFIGDALGGGIKKIRSTFAEKNEKQTEEIENLSKIQREQNDKFSNVDDKLSQQLRLQRWQKDINSDLAEQRTEERRWRERLLGAVEDSDSEGPKKKEKDGLLGGLELGDIGSVLGTAASGLAGLLIGPIIGYVGTIFNFWKKIGSAFKTILGKSKILSGIFGKITSFFTKTASSVGSWLSKSSKLSRLAGSITKSFTSVASKIGSFAAKFSKLGRFITKFSPIGPIILAVRGVYEVVSSLMSADTWKGKITGALAGVTALFTEIPQMLYNWIIRPVLGWFDINLPKLNLEPKIKQFYGWIWDLIPGTEQISNLLGNFNLTKKVKSTLDWIWNLIPSISQIENAVMNFDLIGNVKSIFNTIMSYIPSISQIKESIGNFDIIGQAKSALNTISDFIPSIEDIKNGLVSAAKSILPGWALNQLGIDTSGDKKKQGKNEQKVSSFDKGQQSIERVQREGLAEGNWWGGFGAEGVAKKIKEINKAIENTEDPEKKAALKKSADAFQNQLKNMEGYSSIKDNPQLEKAMGDLSQRIDKSQRASSAGRTNQHIQQEKKSNENPSAQPNNQTELNMPQIMNNNTQQNLVMPPTADPKNPTTNREMGRNTQ